jgi:hypothetical protein
VRSTEGRRLSRVARMAVTLGPVLAAGVPAATAVSSPATAALAHAPLVPSGPNLSYSANWSGYAAHSGTYQSVSAAWTEPTGHCGTRTTYSSFWVGLDGFGSSTVEQTGSEVDCSGGHPVYYAWYEMYPAGSVRLAHTVRPGDQITASVTASGTTFTLTLTDHTQGWTATENKSLASAKKASAEVIAEAPCCTATGGILPLADFGTVSFSAATVDGSPIGQTSPTRIDIGTPTRPEDSTSALSNGDAFSVKWLRS